MYILDDANKRAKRLTSGSEVMESMRPVTRHSEEDGTDKIIGIFYQAVPNEAGEYCVKASGETPAKPYIVDYTVYCNSIGGSDEELMYN